MAQARSPLLYAEITEKIIRAFYSVFDTLTFGIPETAFQRAMLIALKEVGLECKREVDFDVYYHGAHVGQYRADLVVENKIVVEIKTGLKILRVHETQLIGYLKISRLQVGLLLNFGPTPEFHRFFNNADPRLSEKSFVSEKSEGC